MSFERERIYSSYDLSRHCFSDASNFSGADISDMHELSRGAQSGSPDGSDGGGRGSLPSLELYDSQGGTVARGGGCGISSGESGGDSRYDLKDGGSSGESSSDGNRSEDRWSESSNVSGHFHGHHNRHHHNEHKGGNSGTENGGWNQWGTDGDGFTSPVTTTGSDGAVTTPVTTTGSDGAVTTPVTTTGSDGAVTTPVTTTGSDGAVTTPVTTTGSDGAVTTPVTTTGSDGAVTTPVTTTGSDGAVTTPVTTTGSDGAVTTPVTTTGGDGATTTAPITTTNPTTGSSLDAPASLDAPTSLVFSDSFNTGSLNTKVWSPTWFGNGSTQNNTVMESSNVSEGSNGLNLTLNSNGTGAIVSTNPDDGQSGHTGFQIAPTPGHPVYVQFTADLPGTSNGQVANWPALWLVGQQWPENGEIDVMEGLGGSADYHIHYGTASQEEGPGGVEGTTGGEHTFGALWSTTGVTFTEDGKVVGSENESMTNPMYLVMENSAGSPASPGSTMTVQNVSVYQD